MTQKILIVSGEPSGDLHASNLVKDLKKLNPDRSFFGMGGQLSKDAGVEVMFDISGLALVGLVEVIKNIFVVGRAYKAVLAGADSVKPDLAILVDYPGFNLRLAKELHKRSIPVVYYISPQVWAWGGDRINIIKKYVKKIVVFFKFEEELYRAHGINAEFVGHPLLDVVKTSLSKEETFKRYGLAGKKITVALLPGSRYIEVSVLLPIMVSGAKLIHGKMKNVQFVVAKHPELDMGLYENTLRNSGIDIRIAEGDTYNVLGVSDLAIVASGTATLESAIIGTPLIITYKASLVTYALYRLVRTTKFLGLVNVIAGKEIAPEFLQFDARPEKIADKAAELLSDKNKLSGMKEELKRVRESLGAGGASMRAAKDVNTI